jgi:aryl-alcohol dehydrogenase-like predicted oxidoreductase
VKERQVKTWDLGTLELSELGLGCMSLAATYTHEVEAAG